MQPEGILEPNVLSLYSIVKEAVELAEEADDMSRAEALIRIATDLGILRAGFIAAGFPEAEANFNARYYWLAMVDILKTRALR